MLTQITAPLTTELGRAWRHLYALTRTTVRTHHAAFEHGHCNAHTTHMIEIKTLAHPRPLNDLVKL